MYPTRRVNLRKWIMLLVLLIISAFLVRPVSAGSITVTSFLDVVADDGACTLREAINSANQDAPSGSQPGECPAGSGADEINLLAGTYTLGSQLPGIKTAITIRGDEDFPTIIQASTCDPINLPGGCTPATYRVFTIDLSGNLTLADVTVRHGNYTAFSVGLGGAIRVDGSLLVQNSIVTNNVAYGGGAIYIYQNGAVTVTGSTIAHNKVESGGGGFYNYNGNLIITSSTITANQAMNGSGGGINSFNLSQIQITDTLLSENSARYSGGGVYLYTIGVENLISESTFQDNNSGSSGGAIYIGHPSTQLLVIDTTLAGNTADYGGGIFNYSGTLEIERVDFSGNEAGFYGGGIGNYNGTLEVLQGDFSGNDGGYYGGGIYNYGGALEVANSSFSDNTASQMGGGIYNASTSPIAITITDTVFLRNMVDYYGGGIYSDGKFQITNCWLEGNQAVMGYGGGLAHNYGDGSTLQDSTLWENSAGGGGGIYNLSPLVISGCTFFGNEATGNNISAGGLGGGIKNTSNLEISNSTLSSNSATLGGGIHHSFGLTHLVHCTLDQNTASDQGGGFYSESSGNLSYANTIIANSTGADCAGDGSITVNVQNLVMDGTCGGIIADPLLGMLLDNGGPTKTLALDPLSPAIDAGNRDFCDSLPVANKDQRGVSRPQGIGCDIGAFELVQTIPIYLPLIIK